MLHRKKERSLITPTCIIVILVCTLLWCSGEFAIAAAQQADIGILLPAPASGVTQGDVNYARSVSKRLIRMLNSIGFSADMLEEASLANVASVEKSIDTFTYRLLILPLNPEVSAKTASLLKNFVARGGKLLVTYSLADSVAPLLNLRKKNWLREEEPGQFAAIRLNAPEIQGMPQSVRQASWNITVAEPTSLQTQIIGYWYNAAGEPTGFPALFVGESGAFFSHVFLPDDIQAKMRLLAALLAHLVPKFQGTIAKRVVDAITTVGHTQNLEALTQFVRQSSVPEATEALKRGQDLMKQAHAEYAREAYHPAIATGRASRAAFSKAYCLAHPKDKTNPRKAGLSLPATEGRAVWNHSGLGAYPGDWERSAQELAHAGFNMLIPNMAWGGVAHYASKVLPQSETFTRYGDQIVQCVTAARQHGLEVHVWKITWNLEGAPKEFVENLRKGGRTQVSATGKSLNWLCPSHPHNVQLELDSLVEIAENYDVDGIHLDYIRYPGRHACYCQGCRKRFSLATRQHIREWPASVAPETGEHRQAYTEWRTQQITRLVRLVHKRVRAVKPEIKISAAVYGGYPACVASIGQDWIAWAKAGYVDFVCPMNYTEDTGYFTELLEKQLALMPKGVAIYPGIGATASNSILTPDAVVGQIYLARYLGASGWAIFDYSVDISDTVLPALAMGIGKRKAKPLHALGYTPRMRGITIPKKGDFPYNGSKTEYPISHE